MLTLTQPEDPIYVSSADLEHHMRYLGRTGGFKNTDGSARVPTPNEVVEHGWEPISYLDQFKTAE